MEKDTFPRCSNCHRPKLPKEKFTTTAFDMSLGVFYKGPSICPDCVAEQKRKFLQKRSKSAV